METIDIRLETYEEALASYLKEADERGIVSLEPADEVKRWGLQPVQNLDMAAYPAGTWFYHVDGEAYVREPEG